MKIKVEITGTVEEPNFPVKWLDYGLNGIVEKLSPHIEHDALTTSGARYPIEIKHDKDGVELVCRITRLAA